MNRTEFVAKVVRHKRVLLIWSIAWFVGFILMLWITFFGIGASLALGGVWLSVPVTIMLIIFDVIYIRLYSRFLLRLLNRHGLLCQKCGKGLLSGRNREVVLNGRCGFCGNAVFECSEQ